MGLLQGGSRLDAVRVREPAGVATARARLLTRVPGSVDQLHETVPLVKIGLSPASAKTVRSPTHTVARTVPQCAGSVTSPLCRLPLRPVQESTGTGHNPSSAGSPAWPKARMAGTKAERSAGDMRFRTALMVARR